MNREELLKVSKPILFNTEMVQAVVDGRKTVTRRVVKAEDIYLIDNIISANIKNSRGVSHKHFYGHIKHFIENYSPYKVGDILYVRETWCRADDGYYYKAGFKDTEGLMKVYGYKWHPSIHMPKEIARIFLKITDVRVERLQEIDRLWSNYDREGMRNPKTENISIAMQEKFIDVWNSTIKKQEIDKYGWEANPWVWVIEFERVEVEDEDIKN